MCCFWCSTWFYVHENCDWWKNRNQRVLNIFQFKFKVTKLVTLSTIYSKLMTELNKLDEIKIIGKRWAHIWANIWL